MSQSAIIIDSESISDQFREAARLNAILPTGFAEALSDSRSPFCGLKYTTIDVPDVGPCRVYSFIMREPLVVHLGDNSSTRHTSSAMADDVPELEAAASPIPAIDETIGDAREGNELEAEPIAAATDHDGDASMNEEDVDEDAGFTSIQTLTDFVDPRLKPVDRIIKVTKRGAVLPKLDAVWQLGRLYDYILQNGNVGSREIVPHLKSDNKLRRQVRAKGGLVDKEEYTFTCQCSRVIGPGGWVDTAPCSKVIFGQENWQRHAKEGHLKCGRGISLKSWATEGKQEFYRRNEAIKQEKKTRNGTRF